MPASFFWLMKGYFIKKVFKKNVFQLHKIRCQDNLASISAIFFSSIWLSFQRYFFINPASVSAVYFHQPRSILSSIPLPFQQYSSSHQSLFYFSNTFLINQLPFRQYFYTISLPFQQYYFSNPASISAVVFHQPRFLFNDIIFIKTTSISAIFCHQPRFHFSNIFSSSHNLNSYCLVPNRIVEKNIAEILSSWF